MKRFVNDAIGMIALSVLFLTSCGSAVPGSDRGLKVLASTSFLADIAQNVAGDRAHVESLLPIGADPHAYQATPADVVKISGSNVLILNGIEYEHFIESLLESADGERLVVVATDGLKPREMGEGQGVENADEAGSGSGGREAGDPHLWLDPTLVVKYVENIRDGLSQADPEGAEIYKANADLYIAKLRELDAWIVEQVGAIPVERRLLVTNHGALGYFAGRYGFTIVDTILPSFSSDASASAREVAAAIEAIKSSGAPAIFLDEVENATLADQISAETGVEVVGGLHLESLTDGAPAGTYVDTVKYNVSLIVEALR